MMNNQNAYVSFNQVKKTYNGEEFVVKNLNLDIKKGEFVTMLGPSGSGKTTCLMMLAGFEDVSSGDISINGFTIQNIAPHKRNIGMVFQNYALFPHMTIEQNLAYPLKFRDFDKQKIPAKTKEYLDLVELINFKDRYPSQLSGGQKQRVALARALIYEPDLVLMDEPLGALDKNLREQMQYEIKNLHDMFGFTVVYVTHDQVEALTMSDRIAVFDDGVIQQISDSKALYELPENKFVAEFIGENNYLEGKVNNYNKDIVEILVDKKIIKALAVDVEHGDKHIYLSIRPEKIVIDPNNSNISCDNVFDGIISKIIYVGDHSRIYVTFLENKTFIVKHANSSSSEQLKLNDKVKIGWLSKDCRALKINN